MMELLKSYTSEPILCFSKAFKENLDYSFSITELLPNIVTDSILQSYLETQLLRRKDRDNQTLCWRNL